MRLGLGLGVDSITSQKIGAGFTGILDEYSGAAAAYSVRKLSRTYTGDALRVRRSSDDTEQDIGFNASNELDTTALLAFVNAERDIFTSDFPNGTTAGSGDGELGATRTTLTAPSSIGGETDALQVTCDGTVANYDMRVKFTENGQKHDVSFQYYIPSGNTIVEGIKWTDAAVDTFNTKGAWTSVNLTDLTINNTVLRFFASSSGGTVGIGSGVTESFYIRNLSVSQTTADGHVTRWYSQSDPVDTYTADFSENDDGFVGSLNNSVARLESVTDNHGTTVNNVIELTCSNNTSSDHSARKNNPLPTTGGISNLTLKCSFKMLVPSSNNEMLGATLSTGERTSNGIVEEGKLTEQGRWTTFTDVAWTQVTQDRLTFMGLNDAFDNPVFGNASGEKFYIADVVLTETTDAYNATSTEQPLIVEGGNVVLENGKAALDFDGVDDKLSFASNLNIGGSPSIIGVLNTAVGDIAWRGGGSDYWYFQGSQLLRYRNGDFDASWINSDGLPVITGSQKLIATYKNSTSVELAVDGTSIATKSSGTGTDGNFNNIGSNLLYMDGVWQELIIFTSNQSSNRTGIETNINNHFDIYT